MGTVYKGRHRVTGETVAIKVLSPHMAKNPVMRRRLEQEYQRRPQPDPSEHRSGRRFLRR